MTDLAQLRYRLKLDAPALLTTLAGDPNTVEGERHIPGASLLGAFAATWIAAHRLGRAAHEDPAFARLFLRGGFAFLNAYPEEPGETGVRLLPLPRSLRRGKADEHQGYDLIAGAPRDTAGHLAGYGRLTPGDDQHRVAWLTPRTQLRFHTARADRLLGRPTATAGALFAYDALEGGQSFIGRILGAAADLAALVHDLGWQRGAPLTLALGRSRSAEYGGQARLSLLDDRPSPCSSEVEGLDADNRQEPELGLVLTLTADLLPAPTEQGGLAFPVAPFASGLRAVGVDAAPAQLEQCLRSFVQPILVGGYSGIWRLPRPQLAGFAAGSVFVFPCLHLTEEQQAAVERQALGQRLGEGYGRFVLNWHGEQGRYLVQPAQARRRPPRPASPPPETFRRVAVDVTRRWAAEQAQASALGLAADLARARPPSPTLIRRIANLLRGLDLAEAPALREQLGALRPAAREQLEACRARGRTFLGYLELLCSPDRPEAEAALDELMGSAALPPDWRGVLDAVQTDIPRDAATRARLANLFIQVCCAELGRRLRAAERREGASA